MIRIATLLIALGYSIPSLAADAAGKWAVTATDPEGAVVKAEMTLQQKDGAWSGSILSPTSSEKLDQVSFKDGVLKFSVYYDGADVEITLKLDGDALKGSWDAAGMTGRVEAVRAAAKAGAAGVWNLTTAGPEGGTIKLQLTLKEENGKWSGKIVSDDVDADLDLDAIKIDGEDASFDVLTPIGTYKVTAKIVGDKFTGTAVNPQDEKNALTGGR